MEEEMRSVIAYLAIEGFVREVIDDVCGYGCASLRGDGCFRDDHDGRERGCENGHGDYRVHYGGVNVNGHVLHESGHVHDEHGQMQACPLS